MAADPYNSLGGYSAGIPAVLVIDETGNVVGNVNTSGFVKANAFFYGNGLPLSSNAAGINTEVQFNNNGVFGASPNFTFNNSSSTLNVLNFTSNGLVNLGSVSNLVITGGVNGYFLQTDGLGNLTWAAGGGGGGNGNPGGANTQVQFNDSGVFGGDAGFTYNKNTKTLHVENISAGDSAGDNVNIIGNISVTGNISLSANLVSNGNITATYFIGNGSFLTGVTTNLANYVAQPIQSNITAVGNLAFLNIDGDTTSLGNIATSGNISAGNINLTSGITTGNVSVTNRLTVGSNLTVNSSATLRVAGTFNAAGSPEINLGTLSNIHIAGGVNGYVLTTDGAGNLTWAAGGGGGNGTPGGTNTQVQFNNNGSFAGDPFFTYNTVTKVVQVGGNLVANSVQVGSGVYKWSSTQVYFASTASSTPQQVLFSIPVSECSGVDFEIIATEPAGPSRQFCKLHSLYYNSMVQYNEYASLFVNGGVGNFEVDFNAGNVVTPPSLELKVTPNSANPITYKMLITIFAP